MQQRSAFTLIEVLIAIALMGIILPVLYNSVDVLNNSNRHLYHYLQKTKIQSRAMRTLYLDIAGSDGNLSIRKNEYDRLCIERTTNSLYGLSRPKVCWVVLKSNHHLVRIEGQTFHLPLKREEEAETDMLPQELILFKVSWTKDKVLVRIQEKKKDPFAFLVQGITKPKPPPRKKHLRKKRKHTEVQKKHSAPPKHFEQQQNIRERGR
jgi:prepilin-type N-terminal cleavage/methylation domain-containing protein